MAFPIDQQFCHQVQNLDKYNDQTLSHLCKAAFDCLESGHDLQSIHDEDSKSLVKQTMAFIVQSVKFGLLDSELSDILRSIQCNHHYQDQLVQLFQHYRPGISKILQMFSATSSYKRHIQVQWKLEVKVASRFIREQLAPSVILRFKTADIRGQTGFFDMQCSVADIFHIVDKLGDALRRNNSQHSIKLLRQGK